LFRSYSARVKRAASSTNIAYEYISTGLATVRVSLYEIAKAESHNMVIPIVASWWESCSFEIHVGFSV